MSTRENAFAPAANAAFSGSKPFSDTCEGDHRHGANKIWNGGDPTFQTFLGNRTNKGGFSENAMRWRSGGSIPLPDPEESPPAPGSAAGAYRAALPLEYRTLLQLPAGICINEKNDLAGPMDEAIPEDFATAAYIWTADKP